MEAVAMEAEVIGTKEEAECNALLKCPE